MSADPKKKKTIKKKIRVVLFFFNELMQRERERERNFIVKPTKTFLKHVWPDLFKKQGQAVGYDSLLICGKCSARVQSYVYVLANKCNELLL
jgi:hypothetical protein